MTSSGGAYDINVGIMITRFSDELTDFLYLLISVKKEIEKEEGADATAMLEEKHYTGILLDMFFGEW